MPFTLTQDQLNSFNRDGVLRLPAFYPPERVRPMADRLWADLTERYGARKDDRSTWTTVRPAKFQAIERAGAFRDMDTPDLRALTDQLLGEGAWDVPKWWGQALVTFPGVLPWDTSGAKGWDVPHASWHTDYPATDCAIPLPAVRLFVFLEAVKARSAGTLVVAGSHQAMMKLARETGGSVRSGDAKEIVTSRSSWLRALLSRTEKDDRIGRFMERDGEILGCPVRVVELTGEPGDVVLMHPGMMHAGAANAGDWPRMMLVQSLNRRDWMTSIRYR